MPDARNPYERRHRDFEHGGASPEPAAHFEMAEMHAVVRSAYQRGRAEQREVDDDAQRREALVAWDNGYANGAVAGRVALLDVIESHFRHALAPILADADRTLERFDADGKEPTRAELVSVLRRTRDSLRYLEQAPANGFEPLPW